MASVGTVTQSLEDPVSRSERTVRMLTVVHPPGGQPNRVVLGGQRLVIGRRPGRGGLDVADGRASRQHFEITWSAALGVHRMRDLGSKNGTMLDGRRTEAGTLAAGSVLRLGDTLLVYSEADLHPGLAVPALAEGESMVLAQARHLAALVARSTLPVLVHGPTGAGKELIARLVHEGSGRPGPLVTVNCATFTRELIASELFGHVRGAFSGAHGARAGLFTQARQGTLFLDEIAELPLDQQPALLRAIQEQRIRPVGSDAEVATDVRVVSATHADLIERQAEGRFRDDLYARLAGAIIPLPGLARRREEVLPLFRGFLTRPELPVTVDAAKLLLLYDWPLNVRELQHVAQAASLYATGSDAITPEFLPEAIRECAPQAGEGARSTPPGRVALERLLAENAGNVTRLAAALGESRQVIYRRLEAHGIDPARFRGSRGRSE